MKRFFKIKFPETQLGRFLLTMGTLAAFILITVFAFAVPSIGVYIGYAAIIAYGVGMLGLLIWMLWMLCE